MIVCVDVGNTNTTFGILRQASVEAIWRITTRDRTSDEYGHAMKSMLDWHRIDPAKLRDGAICSVVPSETDEICNAVSAVAGVETHTVDGNSDSGISILTENPSEVGGDRIANAAGAYYDYGGPAVVIDMGTATTFDYVSGEGQYLGGLIAPGIVAGARRLWESARMLPAVEIKAPPRIIGTTTVTCMQAGIYYGNVGLVEGVVRRIWEDVGGVCKVILTGGCAGLIREGLNLDFINDEHLTLKGLAYAVDPGLREKARQPD
jgi:type III pantothenate kinase